MITTDLIIIIALSIAALSWWLRRLPQQRLILAACASVALVAGVVGVADHRWQDAAGAAVAALLLGALLLGRLRNKSVATGLPWLSGSAVAFGLAAAIAPLYLFPVTDLPPPSGQYPVGTRDFELADPDRLGVFAAAATTPRRLLVRTWYPASDVDGMSTRPYFSEEEVASTATGLGQMVGMPFLFQYIKHVTTNSYTNAPLLTHASDLPVLFYSHGYTSFAGQNTALMEELASHGYVVYSVQHSYDASPTLLPNGDVIPLDPELIASASEPQEVPEAMKQAYGGATFDERYLGQIQLHRDALENLGRINQSAPVWLADRLFVLNALQNLQVPDSVRPVVAASDFTATGQMGMSFGGSTSGGLCMVDARCVAGVNLDGGDYHDTPFGNNIPVPFMMFYSDFQGVAQWADADPDGPLHGINDFSYERPELAGLRGDIYRPMIRNVKHLGISDFTLFTRNPVRQTLFGSIDADAMIQIQNDFVRGFFDTHLRGYDVGFPDRQYQRHANWVERTDTSDVRQWWLSNHPEDIVQRVVFDTSGGDIEVALYPKRAPLAVENFLANVDAGHLDGSSFHRATNSARGRGIDITLGEQPLQSMASGEPAVAGSEFFFNLENKLELTASISSGIQGHTALGRVMRGIRILEKIQPTTEDLSTQGMPLKDKVLTNALKIRRVYQTNTAKLTPTAKREKD